MKVWTLRSRTHLLAQVGAYLEVSGPLGVQQVTGVDEVINENLGIANGYEEHIMTYVAL